MGYKFFHFIFSMIEFLDYAFSRFFFFLGYALIWFFFFYIEFLGEEKKCVIFIGMIREEFKNINKWGHGYILLN